MERKQRFSFRKQKSVVVSVLIGTLFLCGTKQVSASEGTPDSHPRQVTILSPDSNSSDTQEIGDNSSIPDTSKQVDSVHVSSSNLPTTLSNHLDTTHVTSVWEESHRGEGRVVAVLDTELNTDHEAFKNDQLSYPKIKSEEDLGRLKEANQIDYGQWRSPKIIFTHDYVKNTEEVKDKDTHGSHVAGIAIGEGKTPLPNGLIMSGVAPKAQLMFMKVGRKPSDKEVVKQLAVAIQDAVNLGSDTINMSFGRAAESEEMMDVDVAKSLEYAKQKGVIVVTSAGNDRAFGDTNRKPLAAHPDFGVIGTPAASETTLTVASYITPNMYSEYFTTSSGERWPLSVSQGLTKSFDSEKNYTFADAGLGREEDFSNLDVNGKIALVERGDIDFADKIKNAKHHGAIGVLIFNNKESENLTLPLSGDLAEIPSAFISKEVGEQLRHETSHSLSFQKGFDYFANPGGGKLSDYTSWGVTSDGHLKPDISAPGGTTFSASAQGNDYESLEGTSMAAPHVTGIVTLLKSIYSTRYPDKTPEELAQLIKQVVMSSASAIYDASEHAYYSPRQQGAGLIDASKASKATAYVTDRTGQGKVNLGDVKDQITLEVYLHNMSDQEQTYYYVANLNTDKVEEKHFALASRELSRSEMKSVAIAKNSTQKITLTMDVSQFKDELLKQMPNGYFLDGFVRFMKTPDGEEEMSIPFVGFSGPHKFADLPAIEKSIYDNPTQTFYFEKSEDSALGEFELDYLGEFKEKAFTALLSKYASWAYVEEAKAPDFSEEESFEVRSRVVLGAYDSQGGLTKTLLFVDGKPYLSISPNNDGNMDFVQFRGTLLRNVKDLKVSVYRQDHLEIPIWESPVTQYSRKNFSDLLEKTLGYTTFENTTWNGTDQYGQYVGDGTYVYRVYYTPSAIGAKEQFMDFTVILNTQAPPLPTNAIYNEEKRILIVEKLQQIEQHSPIFRTRLAYKEILDGIQTVQYIDLNENSEFVIPTVMMNEDQELPLTIEQLTYVIEDRSGNYGSIAVSELLTKMDQSQKEDMNKPNVDSPSDTMTPETEDNGNDSNHHGTHTNSLREKKRLPQPIAEQTWTHQNAIILPMTGERSTNNQWIALGVLLVTISLYGLSNVSLKQQQGFSLRK